MTNVLVVDNDPGIRRTVADILRGEQLDVELAENGVSALQAVQRRKPDLIVLDLLMPVMGGYELFRRLDAAGERPPVLIISGYGAEQGCRELGAEASLEKPFDLADLLEAVQSLLKSD